MESFPHVKARDRCAYQCSDCGNDSVTQPEWIANETKAANNGQSSAKECSVDSTDRDNHSPACLKCLQARTKRNSDVEGSTNTYEPTHCGTIGDYLEKCKDDNYFEEFLLPEKVLSKFALLLGKCVLFTNKLACTNMIFICNS